MLLDTLPDAPEGRLTGRLAFVYAAALLPITAALSVVGITGGTFLFISQIVGLGFVVLGWTFLRLRSEKAARRLFLASILYLPAVLGLMVVDMDKRSAADNVVTHSPAESHDSAISQHSARISRLR